MWQHRVELQLIRTSEMAPVLVCGGNVLLRRRPEEPRCHGGMEMQNRAGIALRLDRNRFDETVVAFLELNAFGLRNAMHQMRSVSRGQMELEAVFVVADAAQWLFIDLMLSPEVLIEKLEGGTRS